MTEKKKKTEPEKRLCPFNPANECDSCKLQVNSTIGKECVFVYLRHHLQGLDQFQGAK